MSAGSGYSGTPLVRKLGLEEGMSVRLLGPPDGYWALLGGSPEELNVRLTGETGEDVAFTHLFATSREELNARFAIARKGMAVDGMVWASWPKKSSAMESEIARPDVMAAGKALDLVDVKVCAVDETWSGLRFVVPLADR